jgi:hypothetical protein
MAKRSASKRVKALAVGVPVATAGVTMLSAQPAAAGARSSVSQDYTFTTTSQQQVTCTITVTTENANYNDQPGVAYASADMAPNTPACTAVSTSGAAPGAFFCAFWTTPTGGNGDACDYYNNAVAHRERLFAPVRANGYFEVFFEGRFTNCASGECNFSISHLAPTK